MFDQLAKLAALPRDEFESQYPAVLEKFEARSANPAARRFFPSLSSIFGRDRLHYLQMEMFKAALAEVQGGLDKLKEFKDPYGTGPFELRTLEKGFELKSQLLYMGKPVILRVGDGQGD